VLFKHEVIERLFTINNLDSPRFNSWVSDLKDINTLINLFGTAAKYFVVLFSKIISIFDNPKIISF